MYQRVTKPGRPFAILPVLLACLLCSSDSFPGEPTLGDTAASGPQIPVTPQPPKILVILGLKEETNHLVEIAIADEFSGLDVQQIKAREAASPDYPWPAVDSIVTAGRYACQLALQADPDTPILCTLLTEEGFQSLNTSKRKSNSSSLSALVIDQPVIRQMKVASRIYPSLVQFSIFSGYGTGADPAEIQSAVDVFPFRKTVPLPTQLSDVLSAHDALIATSDSSIYNASTLSTVLLTAYGYGKPVIGFSRAYVKAGALLTCYSTPGQILRQVAQYLLASPKSKVTGAVLFYPDYFSVVENPQVSRSLGLTKEFGITAGKTYTDADFTP